MGGLFPVSMSISISSVFPMSPLLLEIILSNRLHRSWNLPLVSSLIWASFKSTFLCVSTSAGDLIKFVAVVRTLWRLVFYFDGGELGERLPCSLGHPIPWCCIQVVDFKYFAVGVVFLCKGYDMFLW